MPQKEVRKYTAIHFHSISLSAPLFILVPQAAYRYSVSDLQHSGQNRITASCTLPFKVRIVTGFFVNALPLQKEHFDFSGTALASFLS
jgi:hypothetical protein